jgi:transposase
MNGMVEPYYPVRCFIIFITMNTATLLADPTAVRLQHARPSTDSITLVVKTISPHSSCPRCHRKSKTIHSRYVRCVADLPWQGISVRLKLHTRRFRCKDSLCPRHIFCERLPSVVSHYARKTVRLSAVLELIGFAIGGEAGARLARELGLAVSPDSLLRRLRQPSQEETTAPRIIGVDDCAFRRGRRYGTLLVDLERRCPIDLLPDRDADTLSAWLKTHPGIEIVTRDRSKTYASGITEGAPTAVQVADRWHLFKNLREALEKLLKRQLQQKRQYPSQRFCPPTADGTGANNFLERSRVRLLPHLLNGKKKKRVRSIRSPPARLPSSQQAAWMLLQPEKLDDNQQFTMEKLCHLFPQIERAKELAQEFGRIVRERLSNQFNEWLRSAAQSKLKEFVSFARGLSEDYGAVMNALRYDWSNGQLEGQVNRLKLIKRQMYGRAKFDLLRARVLHSTK